MRFVALLRGINVGGRTMVRVDDILAELEQIGHANVSSYINSGNFAFDTKMRSEANMISEIESALEARFGRPIAVMVRPQSAIGAIIENNPFAGEFESHKEMHVLFMKGVMPHEAQSLLLEKQTDDERFAVCGREIYCHLRRGVADSLLGSGFIEKRLKIPVTGRNWRTVEKLSTL